MQSKYRIALLTENNEKNELTEVMMYILKKLGLKLEILNGDSLNIEELEKIKSTQCTIISSNNWEKTIYSQIKKKFQLHTHLKFCKAFQLNNDNIECSKINLFAQNIIKLKFNPIFPSLRKLMEFTTNDFVIFADTKNDDISTCLLLISKTMSRAFLNTVFQHSCKNKIYNLLITKENEEKKLCRITSLANKISGMYKEIRVEEINLNKLCELILKGEIRRTNIITSYSTTEIFSAFYKKIFPHSFFSNADIGENYAVFNTTKSTGIYTIQTMLEYLGENILSKKIDNLIKEVISKNYSANLEEPDIAKALEEKIGSPPQNPL